MRYVDFSLNLFMSQYVIFPMCKIIHFTNNLTYHVPEVFHYLAQELQDEWDTDFALSELVAC